MSNITHLKRDAIARRVCGWHYGADELPLDPITLQADALAAVKPYPACHRDDCVTYCKADPCCMD